MLNYSKWFMFMSLFILGSIGSTLASSTPLSENFIKKQDGPNNESKELGLLLKKLHKILNDSEKEQEETNALIQDVLGLAMMSFDDEAIAQVLMEIEKGKKGELLDKHVLDIPSGVLSKLPEGDLKSRLVNALIENHAFKYTNNNLDTVKAMFETRLSFYSNLLGTLRKIQATTQIDQELYDITGLLLTAKGQFYSPKAISLSINNLKVLDIEKRKDLLTFLYRNAIIDEELEKSLSEDSDNKSLFKAINKEHLEQYFGSEINSDNEDIFNGTSVDSEEDVEQFGLMLDEYLGYESDESKISDDSIDNDTTSPLEMFDENQILDFEQLPDELQKQLLTDMGINVLTEQETAELNFELTNSIDANKKLDELLNDHDDTKNDLSAKIVYLLFTGYEKDVIDGEKIFELLNRSSSLENNEGLFYAMIGNMAEDWDGSFRLLNVNAQSMALAVYKSETLAQNLTATYMNYLLKNDLHSKEKRDQEDIQEELEEAIFEFIKNPKMFPFNKDQFEVFSKELSLMILEKKIWPLNDHNLTLKMTEWDKSYHEKNIIPGLKWNNQNYQFEDLD